MNKLTYNTIGELLEERDQNGFYRSTENTFNLNLGNHFRNNVRGIINRLFPWWKSCQQVVIRPSPTTVKAGWFRWQLWSDFRTKLASRLEESHKCIDSYWPSPRTATVWTKFESPLVEKLNWRISHFREIYLCEGNESKNFVS